MILIAREDVALPIDTAFHALTDLDQIERAVLRRGIDMRRTDGGTELTAGARWEMKAKIRGKKRDLAVEVTKLDAPNLISADSTIGGMAVLTTIELIEIARGSTRVTVKSKLKPSSLSARLLVQSMKLTRGSVEKKFAKRVAEYARGLESRARTS